MRSTRDDPLTGLGAYLLWLGADYVSDDDSIRRAVDFMLDLLLSLPLPQTDARDSLPGPVAGALDWWREAWAEPPLGPVPTASMAAAGQVSAAHLNRLFAQATGTAPAAAVSLLRCARTENLLVSTDLPVAAIARECGDRMLLTSPTAPALCTACHHASTGPVDGQSRSSTNPAYGGSRTWSGTSEPARR